jgi:uncharacterized repeat protein (TIGR03803 family)
MKSSYFNSLKSLLTRDLSASKAFPSNTLFLAILLLGIFSKTALAETYSILARFDGKNGSAPASSVILDANGNLYGTTSYGPKRLGTIFKLTPQGMIQTLLHFSRNTGNNPVSGLVWGKDGNLYGTTRFGGKSPDGNNGDGTIYKLTPGGQYSLLHVFSHPDGRDPGPSLLLANDGNFYGVTTLGGTIYRINSNGNFKVLYQLSGHKKLEGDHPSSSLIQAKDGFLYGTTDYGGKYNYNLGTIFKISLDGNFSTIWHFNDKKLKDGRIPRGGLVEGSDGNLYGTTREGGNHGYGTIFKITPNGNLTTLFHFNGQNGRYPQTALIEGNKGTFYGTTFYGGNSNQCSYGCGTLFKVTSDGTLTTLINFDGENGSYPAGNLTKDRKGNIYGTTSNGGSNSTCPETTAKGCGLVFRLSP